MRAGQLQRVTWTRGLKWAMPAPLPFSIAWVALGRVMNRLSSRAAGGSCELVNEYRFQVPWPLTPGVSMRTSRSCCELLGHPERNGQPDTLAAPHLFEGSRVALEDALSRFGNAELREYGGSHPGVLGRSRPQQPLTVGEVAATIGHRAAGDDDELVSEERTPLDARVEIGEFGADGHIDLTSGHGVEQLTGRYDGELDFEVLRLRREQLDQTGCCVLVEQCRSGQSQAVACRPQPDGPRAASDLGVRGARWPGWPVGARRG